MENPEDDVVTDCETSDEVIPTTTGAGVDVVYPYRSLQLLDAYDSSNTTQTVRILAQSLPQLSGTYSHQRSRRTPDSSRHVGVVELQPHGRTPSPEQPVQRINLDESLIQQCSEASDSLVYGQLRNLEGMSLRSSHVREGGSVLQPSEEYRATPHSDPFYASLCGKSMPSYTSGEKLCSVVKKSPEEPPLTIPFQLAEEEEPLRSVCGPPSGGRYERASFYPQGASVSNQWQALVTKQGEEIDNLTRANQRQANMIQKLTDEKRLLERRVAEYDELSRLPGQTANWLAASSDPETRLLLLQEQLNVYKEDFENERKDKEKLLQNIDSLKKQVSLGLDEIHSIKKKLSTAEDRVKELLDQLVLEGRTRIELQEALNAATRGQPPPPMAAANPSATGRGASRPTPGGASSRTSPIYRKSGLESDSVDGCAMYPSAYQRLRTT